MKKFLYISLALLINFLLFGFMFTFYAVDGAGKIAKDTTNIPVILFLIGCYVLPWYALNRKSLSKGLHLVTMGLVSWSFLFMWTLLALTEGLFSGFSSVLSFFGSIVIPVAVFFFMRSKEKKLAQRPSQKLKEQEDATKPKITLTKEASGGTTLHSLDALTTCVDTIKDPDVSQKGQEILTLLTTINDNAHTLGMEETHIINRLISSDLQQLFDAYLSLNTLKQDEIEADILQNLDIIVRYLHSVVDGVSNAYLKEIQTSMHLIETRYKN